MKWKREWKSWGMKKEKKKQRDVRTRQMPIYMKEKLRNKGNNLYGIPIQCLINGKTLICSDKCTHVMIDS